MRKKMVFPEMFPRKHQAHRLLIASGADLRDVNRAQYPQSSLVLDH